MIDNDKLIEIGKRDQAALPDLKPGAVLDRRTLLRMVAELRAEVVAAEVERRLYEKMLKRARSCVLCNSNVQEIDRILRAL